MAAEMADEDIAKLMVWSKARLPPMSSLWSKIGLHDPRAGDLERDLVERVGYSTLSRRSKPTSGAPPGPLSGAPVDGTGDAQRDPVLEHQVALELKMRMNVYVVLSVICVRVVGWLVMSVVVYVVLSVICVCVVGWLVMSVVALFFLAF